MNLGELAWLGRSSVMSRIGQRSINRLHEWTWTSRDPRQGNWFLKPKIEILITIFATYCSSSSFHTHIHAIQFRYQSVVSRKTVTLRPLRYSVANTLSAREWRTRAYLADFRFTISVYAWIWVRDDLETVPSCNLFAQSQDGSQLVRISSDLRANFSNFEAKVGRRWTAVKGIFVIIFVSSRVRSVLYILVNRLMLL